MNEIVTAIKRVTDIMGEISSASAEQSAAWPRSARRSRRWTRRRSRTPRSSRQSAAAAENLRAQAQQLVAAVAVFKLSLARDDGEAARRRRGCRDRAAPPRRLRPGITILIASPGRPARPEPGARNVARLPAGPRPAATAPHGATGTDDDWTAF